MGDIPSTNVLHTMDTLIKAVIDIKIISNTDNGKKPLI